MVKNKLTVAEFRQLMPEYKCVSGLKIFCEQHQIDWHEAVKSGISIETLSQIDDFRIAEMLERLDNG